jgi:hypothetical protein
MLFAGILFGIFVPAIAKITFRAYFQERFMSDMVREQARKDMENVKN